VVCASPRNASVPIMPMSKRERLMDTKANGWLRAGGWCEVVALLLVLGAAHRAQADAVYRCSDGHGHIAYQDRACANAQQETRVEIAQAPPQTPSPEYGDGSHARSAPRGGVARKSSRRGGGSAAGPLSYECRASSGEVFYRHSGCPKSIKATGAAQARGHKQQGSDSAAVSATPIARSEACRRLAAAGSIGRSGHQHDEQVSTYDRNAGRDPCRNS
jgi:hypothetical protein